MRLPQICIEHPVFAIVLNLILIIIGFIGFQHLDTRYFPQMEIPVVTVSTYFEGASQDLMETGVTNHIEDYLGGVDGIDSIKSSSWTSNSSISIRFKPDANFEEGVNQVRDKVSAARKYEPSDADLSIISVGGVDSPVLSVSFMDPNMDPQAIRDYADYNLVPVLREVAGVGSISVLGSSPYALRIWIDPTKMASMGVTATDVKNALMQNNIDFPAGTIIDPERNYSVKSAARLMTVGDFKKMIVLSEEGRIIRLSDIAHVELGKRSLQEAPMRVNGKPAVDLEIKPLRTANPIDVAKKVKAALKNLNKSLPHGMTSQINYDQSQFLKSSIHETYMAILEAVILVILVVYLFLGSLRASLIPIVTIPLCIISVFGVMLAFGFSINVMTLLAVVLAIGLVVDDAIVMLENIHRYIEHGMDPYAAAMKGSKQIAFAIVAMTITLAAVYAPIGFSAGPSAVIFKQFAFTLAGAVIISGFVALTLSPMMCSKILRVSDTESGLSAFIDRVFEKLDAFYKRRLGQLIDARWWIILVLVIIALLGVFLFKTIQSEFLPTEDTGLIMTSVVSPSGSSIDYTDRYMKQIEGILAKLPGVQAYYSTVNGGSATGYIALKPWSERKYTTEQLVGKLTPKLLAIPGVDAFAYIPSPVPTGADTDTDITIQLMTSSDYKELLGPMNKIVDALTKYPGLEHVQHSLKFDTTQYLISINRDLAADLNVDMQSIADTISIMLGGQHITDLQSNGRNYEVVVQIAKKDLNNFVGLQKLYVSDSTGKLYLPLSNFVTLKPTVAQSTLTHYNRMRSTSITAQLAPGYSMSQAVKFVQSVVPGALTPNVHFAYDGKTLQFIQSQGSITGIFALALLFIYLILAAQFGSFIDPFIVLFTVPLCIVGALVFLKITGGTLNLFSEIGLVTLVGLISKHGILITQFINELRMQGTPMREAILQGAAVRLRPILMTTSAMVLGTIPLAIATGPGSVGRNQIGWVIVGGLLLGTFFSLVVVPIAYSFLGVYKKTDVHQPKQIEKDELS